MYLTVIKNMHCIKLFDYLRIDYLMKLKTISQRDANTLTHHIDDFEQDCGNSLGKALELLLSHGKPSRCENHKTNFLMILVMSYSFYSSC